MYTYIYTYIHIYIYIAIYIYIHTWIEQRWLWYIYIYIYIYIYTFTYCCCEMPITVSCIYIHMIISVSIFFKFSRYICHAVAHCLSKFGHKDVTWQAPWACSCVARCGQVWPGVASVGKKKEWETVSGHVEIHHFISESKNDMILLGAFHFRI